MSRPTKDQLKPDFLTNLRKAHGLPLEGEERRHDLFDPRANNVFYHQPERPSMAPTPLQIFNAVHRNS